MMISSRKESNVKKAVEELRSQGLQVAGTVCHVGKSEDRRTLFEKVRTLRRMQIMLPLRNSYHNFPNVRCILFFEIVDQSGFWWSGYSGV